MLWVLFSDLGKCRTREGIRLCSMQHGTQQHWLGVTSSDQNTTSLSLNILHKVEIIILI